MEPGILHIECVLPWSCDPSPRDQEKTYGQCACEVARMADAGREDDE